MGTSDEVVRFSLPTWQRGGIVALSAVPAMSLVVASVRYGDWSFLAVILLVAALTVGTGVWVAAATGVTVTPSHLVIGQPSGRVTAPWDQITSVEQRWNVLWVQTVDGWYPLPLKANAYVEGAGALGPLVVDSWIRRRGPDWGYRPSLPWRPSLDLRGRVVLRRPPWQALTYATGWLFLLAGQTIGGSPARDLGILLGGHLLVVGVVAILVLAHRWWSRTVIDEHQVVVRSLLGITRVDRAAIVGVREQSTARGEGRQLVVDELVPAWGPGAVAHVRSVALPVVSSGSWLENDPSYYRIWAWLHEHVVPEHPDVTVALDRMLDR